MSSSDFTKNRHLTSRENVGRVAGQNASKSGKLLWEIRNGWPVATIFDEVTKLLNLMAYFLHYRTRYFLRVLSAVTGSFLV